jgi:hypothetical protein
MRDFRLDDHPCEFHWMDGIHDVTHISPAGRWLGFVICCGQCVHETECVVPPELEGAHRAIL